MLCAGPMPFLEGCAFGSKAGDLASPVSASSEPWDTVAGQRRTLTGFAFDSCGPAARNPPEARRGDLHPRIRLWVKDSTGRGRCRRVVWGVATSELPSVSESANGVVTRFARLRGFGPGSGGRDVALGISWLRCNEIPGTRNGLSVGHITASATSLQRWLVDLHRDHVTTSRRTAIRVSVPPEEIRGESASRSCIFPGLEHRIAAWTWD